MRESRDRRPPGAGHVLRVEGGGRTEASGEGILSPMASQNLRLVSLLTILGVAAVGCDSPASAPAPSEEAAVAAEEEAGSAEVAEAPAAGGAPVITADAATFAFGSIHPGQIVEHVFKIKNAGDADLHIERVQKT